MLSNLIDKILAGSICSHVNCSHIFHSARHPLKNVSCSMKSVNDAAAFCYKC